MRLSRSKAKQFGIEIPGDGFASMCVTMGLPEPVPEFCFAPPRKWRFDWAFIPQRIAVEIQGGLFTQGRHTRGAALLKEYEKLNAACISGYRMLFVTPQQMESGEVFSILKRAFNGK